MKRMKYLVILGVAVLGLVLVARGGAQEEKDRTIGQRVDRAIGQLREGAGELAGDIRETVEQMRVRVERMGVAARVYARLHWDKALTGAAVSVDVEKDGAATLTGTVPNEQAKAKAETLAGDTVGVERVVNNLQVVPPAGP
jgi:hypothetical protein